MLIRLRIEIGGPLGMRHWTSGFHKPWSCLELYRTRTLFYGVTGLFFFKSMNCLYTTLFVFHLIFKYLPNGKYMVDGLSVPSKPTFSRVGD